MAIRTKEIRLLSPADLQKILSVANEEIKPALVAQAYCGLRVAEVARLEWKDILPGGHIVISAEKAKTGRRRLPPIPPTALRYLLAVRKSSGYFFGGDKRQTVDALQIAIREVRKACPEVRWHRNALRASALSYRLALTQDGQMTALEMGNSPGVLLRDYRELTPPEEAEKWFSIDPSDPLKPIEIIKFDNKTKAEKAN
jgi:integrase